MNHLPLPVNILGIDIIPLTSDQVLAYIASVIKEEGKELVLNVNTHCMNLAYEKPWLKTFLNSSNLVFCDGAGVILGAKILGEHIPERITFADWTWELSEFCELHGYTLFFLGAKPGVADKAAEKLQERYPNLRIVGTHDGYFDKSIESSENQEVIKKINARKPNILIMGMGMPLQERWLVENWDEIDANVALTGGAVFDYLSGDLKRAPRWMTENGLEWLGRLLIEPNRLWQRYILGNPRFLWRVIRNRFPSFHSTHNPKL